MAQHRPIQQLPAKHISITSTFPTLALSKLVSYLIKTAQAR